MLGAITATQIESGVLRDNYAGEDPHRPLYIYTPPHYNPKRSEPYPLLVVLAPWTSAGRIQFEWKPFRESLPDRLERLVAERVIAEAVVVAPDLYTRFGGSQFIDSSYFGAHGQHIIHEVLPYMQKNYHVRTDADGTAVFGRSSGGFGALRLALDYPGVFGRVASHSGDLGFDTMFLGDLQTFPRLLGRYQDNIEKCLDEMLTKPKLQGHEVHALMLLGMCGFYSPNPQSPLGYDIPIDLYSGAINWEIWQRWKEHDPVEMVTKNPSGFTKLSSLYVECGVKDQYHLLYGARQLKQKLVTLGIAHRYEEFDDNHSGTEYRYDISLPLLSPL